MWGSAVCGQYGVWLYGMGQYGVWLYGMGQYGVWQYGVGQYGVWVYGMGQYGVWQYGVWQYGVGQCGPGIRQLQASYGLGRAGHAVSSSHPCPPAHLVAVIRPLGSLRCPPSFVVAAV